MSSSEAIVRWRFSDIKAYVRMHFKPLYDEYKKFKETTRWPRCEEEKKLFSVNAFDLKIPIGRMQKDDEPFTVYAILNQNSEFRIDYHDWTKMVHVPLTAELMPAFTPRRPFHFIPHQPFEDFERIMTSMTMYMILEQTNRIGKVYEKAGGFDIEQLRIGWEHITGIRVDEANLGPGEGFDDILLDPSDVKQEEAETVVVGGK